MVKCYSALFLSLLLTAVCVALPDAQSGGKDGKPVSVLFLTGRIGSGLDYMPMFEQRISDLGYVHQTLDMKEPLETDFLRQFNVVVLVGIYEFEGGGYYKPGGLPLLNVAKNIQLIQKYVQAGGGLIVIPVFSENGNEIASSYAKALEPFDVAILGECVRDEDNPVADLSAPDQFLEAAWTRAINGHPATAGVSALAYPNRIMRWDDAYSTTPIVPKSDAWTVLATGESTSRSMLNVGVVGWVNGTVPQAPVLAAARESGKGRVGVVAIGGHFLVTHTFADKDARGNPVTSAGEANTGPLNGIYFEKGDGKTSSDWGRLLDQIIRWTAQASTNAGMGGAPAKWETRLDRVTLPDGQVPDFAIVDWRTQSPPPTWRHRTPTPVWWQGAPFYDEITDPLVINDQRMNKLLIGAHSEYSDGKGSVRQWADAAKTAGFSAIVFTERFESFDPARWKQFVSDCAAASDEQFACLQGLDIADTYGNRFLLLGNTNFPNAGLLTEDGKALVQTARLSLGFSQHLAVVHRCGGSKLSKELYRHFQGVSVFTYAQTKQTDGSMKYTLADNGFEAYEWQLNNASNPVPIVVHELRDPADVAGKGTVGFHVIVPSQDSLDVIRYFRYGFHHFFENPHRYYISEGPHITGWSIFNKDYGSAALNRDQWRAEVGATSPDSNTAIKEAVLYDRGRVARRWTPNSSSFHEIVNGSHSHQHHFMLVVTDAKGRRAISPHLRTVSRGYYTRCADRQNWFGAAGSYTGIWPSGTHGIWYMRPFLPVGDRSETWGGKNPLCSKMSLPFAGNALTFTDFTVDERYLRPVAYGMDAWTIHNTEQTQTFRAYVRVGKWHDINTGIEAYSGKVRSLTSVSGWISLRDDFVPTEPIWPIVNQTAPNATFLFDQNGRHVEGKLDGNKNTLIDLPAGSSIGEFLLLTSMTVDGRGMLGFRATAGESVPRDTRWRFAYTYVPPTSVWRRALGASGDTPWQMELTQGQLQRTLGHVQLRADRYVVAGTLRGDAGIERLPLTVEGLNPNWPAALWTPDDLSYTPWGPISPPRLPGTDTGPYLRHIGIEGGIAYAALEAQGDVKFFVGNTLVSENEQLHMAYALWTATEAIIEINNPTDQNIATRVTSPDALPGKYKVDTRVNIPAGASVLVKLSQGEQSQQQ